jgi:hypothetical protein
VVVVGGGVVEVVAGWLVVVEPGVSEVVVASSPSPEHAASRTTIVVSIKSRLIGGFNHL